MSLAEHEWRNIADYVEGQSNKAVVDAEDLTEVTLVQRVSTYRVMGADYEVFDVHTNQDERWWVITNPTNLYMQGRFPSYDETFSFHIGIMMRMMDRDRVETDDDRREQVGAAWRRYEDAVATLDTAREAEDFQSIGIKCRDALIAFGRELGRLSSDQLAVHWLIYTGVQRRARTMGLENFWALRSDPVVVPIRFFLTALDWTESIEAQLKRLLAALYGLGRESLLEDLSHGAGEYLRDEVVYTRGREYDPKVAYVTLKLTHAGGSLLLQALGRTNTFVDELLDEDSSALIDATENMPFIANVTLRSDFPAVVSK